MPPNDPTSPEDIAKLAQMAKDLNVTLDTTGTRLIGTRENLDRLAAAAKNMNVPLVTLVGNLKDTVTGLVNFDHATTRARGALELMGTTTARSTDLLKTFMSSISSSMNEMNKHATLSREKMVALSAVMAGFGAVGDPFKNLAKTDSLSNFTDQITMMIQTMDSSTVAKFASQVGIHMPESLRKAGVGLKDYITALATNADASTHLRDVYVSLAARAGALGNVYDAAGPKLENINKVVAEQRMLIENAADATNVTSETMAKYYDQLMALPGAMEFVKKGDKELIGGTDLLTATTRLAIGTGRDYADVVKDMHMAIREYSANVPEAMSLTAQISEISNRYGIELSDVEQQITATAKAFEMFGKGGLSATDVMNDMVGALKQTGVSGAVASDIAGNFTRQLSQMTIAQRAFLSAQQGGPGGLQGAFNIDNIMRQKDGLQKVFEMTKQQMVKMMGPLVSVKEAAESPAAAAQLTKQILMLRQGPLGQFARTDQEAERLIEAMRSGRPSDFKALSQTMKDPMEKGLEFQKQTATGISQMLRLMQHAAGVGAEGAIDLLQAGTTAAAGFEYTEMPEAVRDMQERRSRFMTRAGTARTDEGSITILNNLMDTLKGLPDDVKASYEGVIGSMREMTPEKDEKEIARLRADIEHRREEAKAGPAVARASTMEQLDKEEKVVDALTGALSPLKAATSAGGLGVHTPGRRGAAPAPTLPGIDLTSLGVRMPGQQVAHAAGAVARRDTTATGAPLGVKMHPQGHRETETGPASGYQDLIVHIEGFCLNCGAKMKNDSQLAATSPATRAAINGG